MSGKDGYGSMPQQPVTYSPQAPPPTSYKENAAVIIQPSMTMPLTQPVRRSRPELGLCSLMFAIISTFAFASLGCFWALPCTTVGIVMGAISTAAGESGDPEVVKQQRKVSIGCTIAGWVSMVVGVIIIVTATVTAVVVKNDQQH